MYCASFTWEAGSYDEQFHQLNALIEEVARSLPGFVAVESWQAPDGPRRCAHYWWRDLASLDTFSRHPAHLEAKRQYARWYRGYQVVLLQVLRSYGDGGLTPLPAAATAEGAGKTAPDDGATTAAT